MCATTTQPLAPVEPRASWLWGTLPAVTHPQPSVLAHQKHFSQIPGQYCYYYCSTRLHFVIFKNHCRALHFKNYLRHLVIISACLYSSEDSFWSRFFPSLLIWVLGVELGHQACMASAPSAEPSCQAFAPEARASSVLSTYSHIFTTSFCCHFIAISSGQNNFLPSTVHPLLCLLSLLMHLFPFLRQNESCLRAEIVPPFLGFSAGT